MIVNKKDISICTQICDRNETLCKVLPTWIKWDPGEILIFDMPEEERSYDVCSSYNNPKVKIYECLDIDGYNISNGKNACLRGAQFSWILYLDSDVEITKYFPQEFNLNESTLYNKIDDSKSRLIDFLYDIKDFKELSLNAGGLSGSFLIHKSAFMGVNGFDERMSGYGYEDDDFRNRLEKSGVKRIDMFFGLRHLYHDNKSRTDKYFIKDKHESWNRNKMLSDMSLWSKDDKQEEFDCDLYIGTEYQGKYTI